jgi:hypothetical protein
MTPKPEQSDDRSPYEILNNNVEKKQRHTWLKLINNKWQCTRCGLIKKHLSGGPVYYKDAILMEGLPECKFNTQEA